jgi:hypothetical protein
VKNESLLKTKWHKQTIWINPNNINAIFDYTNNDERTIQAVLLINGERINVTETAESIIVQLGGDK